MIKSIKTTFDFGKLAKYVESESFKEQSNKLLGQGIVESSRDFMKSGKVTPPLEESTVKIRKIRGSRGNTPLYDTENTKGIKVPARNFIAMDAKRMKKPINALMKKIGKALKK